jgi:hypothetical protein
VRPVARPYRRLAGEQLGWRGATGLAADVRAYGEWMRDEAHKRIVLNRGDLTPSSRHGAPARSD